MTTTPDSSWSIAVRTVGGKHIGHDDGDDFTVNVNPDDALTCLHHQIEGVTGLKASQQRLIYRGRLISGGGKVDEDAVSEKNEPKVRDVIGLCDGQTIHLVPKREEKEGETTTGSDGQNSSSEEDGIATSSDTIGRSLLATLLGLGSLDDDDDEASMSSPSLRRLRSSRSRRRTSHRLTSSDVVVPDPGTMEPVRQGLMTLHTMLDIAQTERPWEACRQWYRGQWVDCRDTVNQWLEATVVDIAHPDDILPERTLSTTRRRRTTQPAMDDAVSANDYEGRRNLLLEPDGEGGYCERHNNHGVHLLLIHYNGWPHRWDEWIRSDSERLRPFRTRTRHNPSSGALPAPQSVFDGAPPTNIKEEDEEGDRAALLPELSRAMSSVNGILEQVVSTTRHAASVEQTPDVPRPTSDLPWLTDADDFPSAWSPENEPRYNRRQLEALAPLLDRLGRALTDAAPHVASFAATLPEDDESSPNESTTDLEYNVIVVGESYEDPPPPPPTEAEEDRSISGSGLFSLLSRDNRARTSAVARESEISRISARLDENIREEPFPATDHDDVADYLDFVNGMVNTARGDTRAGARRGSDDGASLLGAYLALSTLASEGESNNGNGGGGLLGRLLRDRGSATTNDGGGPGIDIHIHAIVTAPGIGPGGLGVAMMAGVPPLTNTANMTPTTNNASRGGLFASRRAGAGATESSQRAIPPTADEDDLGIFSDLYSENPSPLDPHAATDDTDGASRTALSPMMRNFRDEGEENEGASTSPSTLIGSRSRREYPSHQSSVLSQRSRQSPRRRSSLGRVFRSVLGPSSRRRNNAQESDSESHYTDE